MDPEETTKATPTDAKDAKATEEGENDWFFDIIINFLRSPRWKTPVMSFLDEYCIIFDNEEENKLEYTTIHNVSCHCRLPLKEHPPNVPKSQSLLA